MEHKEIKSSGENLLSSTNLLACLEVFGRLHITGSYRYDLMVEPDIDLEVFCEHPKDAAQQFIQDEVGKDRWNGIMYFDWKQWRREYFPEGYYVGFKHDFEGRRWKIDIWFLNTDSEVRNTDQLLATATEEQCELILDAKRVKLQENWPCDSAAIYRAVIENELTSVAEVKQEVCP